MKRAVEVSNDQTRPRGEGTDGDTQMLNDAPKWWRDKVIAIRSAKNEAEVRTICSRAWSPVQTVVRTVKQASSLADLAWKKFTHKFPTEDAFRAAQHPELDDTLERRRQVLNSIS